MPDDFTWRYQMRWRPTWPLIDTTPIVQGLLDNHIEQEARDLVVALASEIERLKAERPDDPAIASLEEARRGLMKIWGIEESPRPGTGDGNTP